MPPIDSDLFGPAITADVPLRIKWHGRARQGGLEDLVRASFSGDFFRILKRMGRSDPRIPDLGISASRAPGAVALPAGPIISYWQDFPIQFP